MRPTLLALATASILALAASPSTASTLAPPSGHYHGVNSHNQTVSFSLSSEWDHVTNFYVHGHQIFHAVAFHLRNLGYFNTFFHGGLHVWGEFPSDPYGHAHGGYSFLDEHGTRRTVHWYAKAAGF